MCGQPATQPPSHVAVASTRYAYLRRAVKIESRDQDLSLETPIKNTMLSKEGRVLTEIFIVEAECEAQRLLAEFVTKTILLLL